MNREEMLKKLQTISEPLVALTAFSDGVICDYVSSNGCGEFELCDWSDLDEYCYDIPHQTWDEMSDDVLAELITRIEDEEFTPVGELGCESE